MLTFTVAGESGLGKSTLVNTLFNTSLYPPRERKGPSLDIMPKTVSIQSISADIEESGVRLRLTVIDTPGFGDFVQILTDIQFHRIQIFQSPRYELDDEETIAENHEIMSKVPFAVVGANYEVTNPEGRKVRGRRYPWGIIEVDNEEHCDFVTLR